MKKTILFLLFIFGCTSLFSQSRCYIPSIKKEVVNSDTVVWETNKSAITAYIQNDRSRYKNNPDKLILKDSMAIKEVEFKMRKYVEESIDSLASVFIENLNPNVVSKLIETENKAPAFVILNITVIPDGHILRLSISFITQREDIMTSEEVYTISRYLQKNFLFKASTDFNVDRALYYRFPIRKEKFFQYFNEHLQNYSSQQIKKEVVNSDTVVWWKDTNFILAYIENDRSKLKDCFKRKYSMSNEMYGLTMRQYFEESIDSFASLFIKNLSSNVVSKLMKSENKAPVAFLITVGSDGYLLDCSIFFKTQQEDIMTSEEVYTLLRYLQKNFRFKDRTKYDAGCASYYFPISKEKLMECKTVGD